jgi:hypothetical protein
MTRDGTEFSSETAMETEVDVDSPPVSPGGRIETLWVPRSADIVSLPNKE